MSTPIELPATPTDGHDDEMGELLFIGTATVLLRYGGFTVLRTASPRMSRS